jgi:hypothetical protein
MRLVEDCQHFPGEAVAGGGSKNVVDTGLELREHGRLYLSLDHAIEAGEAAGMCTPQALDAAVEMGDRLQDELDAAKVEVRALKAALEEAESLRQAIAFTLERGAVLDPKKLTVGLRTKPGQKRIDVGRSLWETYVRDVEQLADEPEPAAA